MTTAIIVAAGKSERMGAGTDKAFLSLGNKPVVAWSLLAFERCADVDRIVLVVRKEQQLAAKAVARMFGISKLVAVVPGGNKRQESVQAGLAACDADTRFVVIHDGARPCITPDVVSEVVKLAKRVGAATVGRRITDTVKRVEKGTAVSGTEDRDKLWAVQTPQAFRLDLIQTAYASGEQATDDATLYARAIGAPHFVPGSEENRKLTTEADWDWAEAKLARVTYGTGFDTHRLVEGRKLYLGGVEIPFEKGLLGHSDADVLLHAIMDAILGACKLGDIGKLFPDTDERYRGVSSRVLLRAVRDLVQKRDMRVRHVDATVIAERPKLAPYRAEMERRIAEDLGISPDAVSVKATTTEGMNDEGKGLCISAQAIASVDRNL